MWRESQPRTWESGTTRWRTTRAQGQQDWNTAPTRHSRFPFFDRTQAAKVSEQTLNLNKHNRNSHAKAAADSDWVKVTPNKARAAAESWPKAGPISLAMVASDSDSSAIDSNLQAMEASKLRAMWPSRNRGNHQRPSKPWGPESSGGMEPRRQEIRKDNVLFSQEELTELSDRNLEWQLKNFNRSETGGITGNSWQQKTWLHSQESTQGHGTPEKYPSHLPRGQPK